MTSRLLPAIALLVFAAALPCQAEIHTFADFTRPANAASLTQTFDFVPNEGWSGTPPNTIIGEESVYLKVTVSWAPATDIGTFQARLNRSDDAGAARWGIGTDGAGFGFITANATSDPDGAGPATAKPTVVAYDKTANTSVTLVLKVNPVKALTNPGGDWWFGDTVTLGAQDGACGFMWINPNLAAAESSQPTPWAAWRSSNDSYSGVSFISDTAGVDLNFSNIAIYTGNDTPFVPSSGIADAGTSTLSASPTSVPANGTSTSTITVTLRDSNGIPVTGKQVSLAGNGSATITTSNNTSNSSGVVNFTVKSSTIGVEQFTATDVSDANLVITQTASVTFTSPVVDAGTSTVLASPTSVPANGSTTSTITVTLKNASGNPLSGKLVSLANTAGPQAAVITAVSPTTDGSGVATFTVKSSTAGTEVFTATGDSVPIAQTASVTFTEPVVDAGTSSVVASPTSIRANGTTTSTITVTLRDGSELPIAGRGVTLAGSPAGTTISPAGAQTTDANGQAAFTVKSTTIGPVVFTATAANGNVAISETASVDFTDPNALDPMNVLIIGGTKDSADNPSMTGNSDPFNPTGIKTQLQNILQGAGLGPVNVTLIDRDTQYSLASWFHNPLPANVETTNRWPNLRGELGTVWNYVIVIGDPYTIEYMPGVYAYGVSKIAAEVAKGSGETVLLMPWPASASSSTVTHYKEVVYRTGRSAGLKVAPAGLAWQGTGSTTNTTRRDFISAASLYSTLWGQSATESSYVYDDALADSVHTIVTTQNAAPQYSGNFSFQNPFLTLGDKRRDVHYSEKGTSTEQDYRLAVDAAMQRSYVTFNSSSYADKYSSDTPEDDGLGWPTGNPMPIAWNHGRKFSEVAKEYVVNPAYWQLGMGFKYQYNSWSSTVEEANDLHISQIFSEDLNLANFMKGQSDTARCIPWRLIWAQIHQQYPTLNPLRDGSGPHVNLDLKEAVGTYMYTLYSGRCPLDQQPATMTTNWYAKKVGYETAWMLGRCQARAPGFKVTPSAATKKTISPGTSETMSVQFILPPKNDVTVNVTISNANAAIVGSQKLIFTPANYNVVQQVKVIGLPGSAAADVFNVMFDTVSTDDAYNQLSDSWGYSNNRTTTQTLTRVDKPVLITTTNRNTPVTINLNVANAGSGNTSLAGPSNGSLAWSGSNVIYTPTPGFSGSDGFAYSVNSAGTLTVGYVDITVNTTPYASWATGPFAHAFTDTAPTGNPDGDILINLQEFAFGLDPTDPMTRSISYVENGALQQTGLPILVDSGGGYLAVFTRRKDHASAGLIYTVQFSADLSLWTPGGTTPTRRTSNTDPGDYEAVSVPFPTTVPVTGGGAEKVPRFFRVSTTGD